MTFFETIEKYENQWNEKTKKNLLLYTMLIKNIHEVEINDNTKSIINAKNNTTVKDNKHNLPLQISPLEEIIYEIKSSPTLQTLLNKCNSTKAKYSIYALNIDTVDNEIPSLTSKSGSLWNCFNQNKITNYFHNDKNENNNNITDKVEEDENEIINTNFFFNRKSEEVIIKDLVITEWHSKIKTKFQNECNWKLFAKDQIISSNRLLKFNQNKLKMKENGNWTFQWNPNIEETKDIWKNHNYQLRKNKKIVFNFNQISNNYNEKDEENMNNNKECITKK